MIIINDILWPVLFEIVILKHRFLKMYCIGSVIISSLNLEQNVIVNISTFVVHAGAVNG